MSVHLDAYLALERVMLELDETDDPVAEVVRDVMDPLWYSLSDEEHRQLDSREIIVSASTPVRLPSTNLFIALPKKPPVTKMNCKREFTDWEIAA